ncbi:MAG: SMP-30/gluconolactonase/LRE family protein [Akkermansiaceae bacterium]
METSQETFDTVGTYRAQWGEGPIWWENCLYYVDIEKHLVIKFDPDTAEEKTWSVSEAVGRVGTVVPRANGGLVVAGDKGIFFLNTETGALTAISDPEPEKANNRFNDGKCSPDGRFFAGTISLVKETGDAALYRLDTDLTLHTAYDKVTNSNGIAWSIDGGTCYYIDTPKLEVLAFDYCKDTGSLTNPRSIISTSHISASPDGMTIDSEGRLWIAFCHGACVACFNPETGEEVRRVELPCLETTACSFGGKNLDELYVTTGVHKSEVEKHAGRLFCIKGLGAKGIPANAFMA